MSCYRYPTVPDGVFAEFLCSCNLLYAELGTRPAERCHQIGIQAHLQSSHNASSDSNPNFFLPD